MPVGGCPGTDNPARPELHVPPGATELFRRVVGAWGNEDLIEKAFAMREYDPGDELDRRAAADPLPARPALHPTPTRSRSPAPTAAAASPTAPTTPRPTHIVDFARDTDLLLIEATLAAARARGPARPPHARRGRRARPQAGARRVLLTHFSDELGEDWAREDAEQAFGGPVEMAREGAIYDV